MSVKTEQFFDGDKAYFNWLGVTKSEYVNDLLKLKKLRKKSECSEEDWDNYIWFIDQIHSKYTGPREGYDSGKFPNYRAYIEDVKEERRRCVRENVRRMYSQKAIDAFEADREFMQWLGVSQEAFIEDFLKTEELRLWADLNESHAEDFAAHDELMQFFYTASHPIFESGVYPSYDHYLTSMELLCYEDVKPTPELAS